MGSLESLMILKKKIKTEEESCIWFFSKSNKTDIY